MVSDAAGNNKSNIGNSALTITLTDENGPDGEGQPLLIHIRLIKLIQHSIQLRHCPVLIAYNWEVQPRGIRVQSIDILDPPFVRSDIVGGKPNELDTPRGEISVREGDGGKFGGADWGIVVRVREEDSPRAAEPVVELSQQRLVYYRGRKRAKGRTDGQRKLAHLDAAVSSISLKVGSDITKSERHICLRGGNKIYGV